MIMDAKLEVNCPICCCTCNQPTLLTMKMEEGEDDWNNCIDYQMLEYSCAMGHIFYIHENTMIGDINEN